MFNDRIQLGDSNSYDRKTITVEPFDAEGDPMIESIIRYNYDKGRLERGYQ